MANDQHWVQQDPVPVILARMEAKLDNALAEIERHGNTLSQHDAKLEAHSNRLSIVETQLQANAVAVAALGRKGDDLTSLKAQLVESSKNDDRVVSRRVAFFAILGVLTSIAFGIIGSATYLASLK